MRTQLRHLREAIFSGYWFVPTMMVMGGTGLAFGLLHLDRTVIVQEGWFYGGGPDGARTLLSVVSGSVITVAGVVFSITIAALTQASSQFGPRLLRNFLRDTGNQIVLGTFVSTYVYCLLILRQVRGDEGDVSAFVPAAAVSVGVLLAAASTAVLIYFIHHVSVSLQAPMVVATVLGELEQVIKEQCSTPDEPARPMAPPTDFERTARVVKSHVQGYVQAVNWERLVELAEAHDLLLQLEHRAGDYLIQGGSLMRAGPEPRCPPELDLELSKAFIVGPSSTPEQDLEFAIRQLVEIAVRALSPGINDPFTAINCVDAIGSVVCRLAAAELPRHRFYGPGGTLRVIGQPATFEGISDVAFNQLRQAGAGNVAVAIRLLEVLARCGLQTRGPEQRAALLRHAGMVYRASARFIVEPEDLEDLAQRWGLAARALEAAP